MLLGELPLGWPALFPIVDRDREINRRSIAPTCDRWGYLCSPEPISASRARREARKNLPAPPLPNE